MMNYACPNCGVIGTNVSCPSHVTFLGINPLPDSIPMPQQTPINLTVMQVQAELFTEIGRLNVLLNERNKEIERLKGLMPPDDRGPGFVGQGSWSVFAEKVVAERDALRDILADLRKKGVIDQLGRTLPLEGHHKDCGHGKDGWSLCTCDELKKADEERGTKQFQLLVEEGQDLRKEFVQKTAGMRGPPQCSKCGDTGLVAYGPNIRGMKRCDCRKESLIKEGGYAREISHTEELNRIFDDLMVDDQETCEHGNLECKRCKAGQPPARDPRQDLKPGELVRFEMDGIITQRQTGGIVKDLNGNDYEPIQYEITHPTSGNKSYIPYNGIIKVIGKEK